MEQWTGAPERDIKIEELDIKTEFEDEDPVYKDCDNQFHAVIFGTDKCNTQVCDDNIYINNESVNNDFQITINDQNENLDYNNVSTVQKENITRHKPDEINIKNEYTFYSKEDNIFKYNFDHEIIVKNETEFNETAMNSEVNHEKDFLPKNLGNEDIAKEFSITHKNRKTKKENQNTDNISVNNSKINAEISIKEEVLIRNSYNKKEQHSVTQKNIITRNDSESKDKLKTRNEIRSKSKENHEMSLLIPISKKKSYICNDCGFNFNHLGNLKRHITRRHIPSLNINKTQEYSCSNCAFKCSNKTTLEKHKNKHRNKPFSCHFCDYTTRLRYALNRHIKTHTGEKQFTCEICDRKCTTKRGLEFHLMIHSGKKPFSCDICDFKAVNKHDVTRHSRIHTGEKPFSCEICGYSCIRKYHLSSHMRKHLRK